jgi:hypothetical protein
MRFFIILFVTFLLILYGENYAEERNNLEVIDSLVIDNITGDIDVLKSEHSDTLAIQVSELNWEKSNYLKILIGNLAAEKSFKVFRNYNSSSSFQGLVLTINQFKTKIEYSKPYNKSFLGRNFVARKFVLEINGQIYSAQTEEVINAIEKNIEYTDEIPYGNIGDIEDANYLFSKGKREDYTFWEKVYEPILVIASVGVVVYLFFTQRT